MKNLSLDRTKIKYLAIIAMIIDHIAMFSLSRGIAEASVGRIALYSAMRVIGRLTAPIMIFFLVEGFIHTSSRKKYGIRLLVFGIISQVPYTLAHYNKWFSMDFNVILMLFITFLMLVAAENIENKALNCFAVVLLIAATFWCDWGVMGPIMALMFYYFKDDRKAQIKGYAVICVLQVAVATAFLTMNGYHWYGELWQAGMFLVIPVLLAYNGEAGSKAFINKWIFYIIYPLHFMVFWLIRGAVVYL